MRHWQNRPVWLWAPILVVGSVLVTLLLVELALRLEVVPNPLSARLATLDPSEPPSARFFQERGLKHRRSRSRSCHKKWELTGSPLVGIPLQMSVPPSAPVLAQNSPPGMNVKRTSQHQISRPIRDDITGPTWQRQIDGLRKFNRSNAPSECPGALIRKRPVQGV